MTIKTTIFTHRPCVSPARFSFFWWRHTRLLMTSQRPDKCAAITWIVIYNSLDIEYIHGDIHGRSWKKYKTHSADEFASVMLSWNRNMPFYSISLYDSHRPWFSSNDDHRWWGQNCWPINTDSLLNVSNLEFRSRVFTACVAELPNNLVKKITDSPPVRQRRCSAM